MDVDLYAYRDYRRDPKTGERQTIKDPSDSERKRGGSADRAIPLPFGICMDIPPVICGYLHGIVPQGMSCHARSHCPPETRVRL
jgi:hypothetical protein